MTLKKRILGFLFVLILLFGLIGCAKCINTEYKNVEVTVVDKYYRGAWIQLIFTGKTTMMIPHPAEYRITVEYNGIEYTISGIDTYNKYKDKIGQTAIGILEIQTYDDGSIEYDITSLE